MSKIVNKDGMAFTQGDNEFDRIINAFYCGQIQALHHLIYFLWRSKRKYKVEDVFRFMESRYCHLIKEYPNFYNQVIKNEKELQHDGGTAHFYNKLFDEMLEAFKNISKNDPKIN